MIIAIDIGSSYVKALVFNASLKSVFEIKARLVTFTPEQGHFEQNPDRVLKKTNEVLAKALKFCEHKQVDAISLSNAMHNIFPIDNNDNPLYNALLWSDTRASSIVNEYIKTKKWFPLYAETGTPIHPMSPLFKIIWFQQNKPEVTKNLKKYISLKEYILHKWIGKYVVDYATASATGLFNIHELSWNKLALQLTSLNESMLSKPVPVDTIYSYPIHGKEPKNDKSIPLIIGATDGCLATISDRPTDASSHLSLTIGTSSAARIISTKPFAHPEGKTFCYYLNKDQYIVGSPSNNGGNILEWLGLKFLNYNDLNKKLTQVNQNILSKSEPCSRGLICIPYLYGERAPVWNSQAKGMFYGVTPKHTKVDFARAVIEGVIMNLRYNTELLDKAMWQTITLSGSVFHIEGIPQLTANIFAKEVQINSGSDLSATGAAIVAMQAVGLAPSTSVSKNDKVYTPDVAISKKFEKHYPKFKKVIDTYYL